MALTGSINGYTPFESTTYASTPSLWTYPTAFYYYDGVEMHEVGIRLIITMVQ